MVRIIKGLIGLSIGAVGGAILGGRYVDNHPATVDDRQVLGRILVGSVTGLALGMRKPRRARKSMA